VVSATRSASGFGPKASSACSPHQLASPSDLFYSAACLASRFESLPCCPRPDGRCWTTLVCQARRPVHQPRRSFPRMGSAVGLAGFGSPLVRVFLPVAPKHPGLVNAFALPALSSVGGRNLTPRFEPRLLWSACFPKAAHLPRRRCPRRVAGASAHIALPSRVARCALSPPAPWLGVGFLGLHFGISSFGVAATSWLRCITANSDAAGPPSDAPSGFRCPSVQSPSEECVCSDFLRGLARDARRCRRLGFNPEPIVSMGALARSRETVLIRSCFRVAR